MISIDIQKYIEIVALVFGTLLSTTYVFLAIISTVAIYSYKKNAKKVKYKEILTSSLAPSISIVAPAYNEEEVIIDSVRSMLSLHYSNYELIIVNDGSIDQTLERLISAYNLVKIPAFYHPAIPTQKIRGVYKSKNESLNKLVVIDKENGGKPDANNAGVNYSKNDYVVCCDVDCILEPDSLQKLIKPVLDSTNKRVVAVGGIVRIVNSCEIDRGKLLKVKMPKNIIARIQVLEYVRSFLFGRMAWTRLNGLLLVSGALGLFDRQLIVSSGGYNRETVGEDMELIVRIREQLKGIAHSVAYIPEPLCWTEAPENINQLSAQRQRWTRGMIQVLTKYKHLLFNPKHKTIGLIAFPYWVLFEWLAPIIEGIGFLLLVYLIFTSQIELSNFFLIFLSVYLAYLLFTLLALIVESILFKQYGGFKNSIAFISAAIIESIFYHPTMTYFAILSNIKTLFRQEPKWGNMKRKGFSGNNE